jgi:hypothetical protein
MLLKESTHLRPARQKQSRQPALASDTEFLNQALVSVDVLRVEIVKQPTALAHQTQ